LASSGIEATRVRLDDRSYAVERRARSVGDAGRVAKNEVLFREVNERIEQAAERAAFDGPMVFVCECGDAECSETLELTLTEYEAAWSQAARFLVVPGHEISDFERALEQNERFALIEKVGEGEAIARGLNPRG
jgi:hypothetical protein